MMPNDPTTPLVAPPPRRGVNWLLMLAIFFGIGTLLFGVLSVYGFASSARSKTILDSVRKQAFDRGQTEQKKSDDERYTQLNQSPFRSYVAPDIYGGFEIKFPKNWNGYEVENQGAFQQINLTIHPDFVRLVTGSDNVYALHVTLNRESYDQTMRKHQDEVKQGKLKVATVTVSGISGSRYEGKFDGKHDGVAVVVPVRDKTVTISTDDKKFLPEFTQVLAQSKILP